MDQRMLTEKFTAMGARVRFAPMAWPRWRGAELPRVTLDVASDRKGEFFDIRVRDDVTLDMEVLDLRRDLRHLLLVDRVAAESHRYLCGHDERHWFVAAIPEAIGANSVVSAFGALQPLEVRKRLMDAHVRRDHRHRRRNEAFVRQGEWFFVPEPGLEPPPLEILYDEPLSRGIRRSKPHRMEFAYRRGGHRVYVSAERPSGGTEAEVEQIMRRERQKEAAQEGRPAATSLGELFRRENERRTRHWRMMVQDPEVYAKGRIRHPDHATVHLSVWHRVYMNTENQAAAGGNVVFLD